MAEHQIIANFEMSGVVEMALRHGHLEEGDMKNVSKNISGYRCVCGESFDSRHEAKDHIS